MTALDPAFWPAAKLARALRARKLGALELFERYAARIGRFNPALNAVCVMDFEAARKAARAADRARGKRGPLHGLPMTVKESFAYPCGHEAMLRHDPPGHRAHGYVEGRGGGWGRGREGQGSR